MMERDRIYEENTPLVEWFETEVSVEEYLEKCVDVETFLEYCRECNNYGRVWSCPPFSFDVMEYWNKYHTFRIYGMKIWLPSSMTENVYTEEEKQQIFEKLLFPEKEKLNQRLLEMEAGIAGSISLSGGSCQTCRGGCGRPAGKECRFPEAMRYSIEALGGNVGLTVTKYLRQELQWIEEGKLPDYFMLIGGLLLPKAS